MWGVEISLLIYHFQQQITWNSGQTVFCVVQQRDMDLLRTCYLGNFISHLSVANLWSLIFCTSRNREHGDWFNKTNIKIIFFLTRNAADSRFCTQMSSICYLNRKWVSLFIVRVYVCLVLYADIIWVCSSIYVPTYYILYFRSSKYRKH